MGLEGGIDGFSFKSLSRGDFGALKEPFMEEEIHATLFEFRGVRRRNCLWLFDIFIRTLLGIRFWVSLRCFFFLRGLFAKILSATILDLVQKIGRVKCFEGFQALSFVGSLNKLLAKVFTNKLKKNSWKGF